MGIPAAFDDLSAVPQRPAQPYGRHWALHWLRPELESNLARARTLLEQHLENDGDGNTLTAVAAQLQTVRGALSMVERHGAARLVAEMLSLLAQLRAGSAPRPEEAYAALSSATLQLSDYLDLLASGEPDRAVLLQSALNELRAARGQPLLSEAELFAAQARSEGLRADFLGPSAPVTPGSAQGWAKLELAGFQQAFLHWFRGMLAGDPMGRIGHVAVDLVDRLSSAEARVTWSCFAALAEALRGGSESLELKRLFGRAGTLLKLLAEQGEEAASAQLGDLPWLLLWQIAQMPRPSPRAKTLLEAAGGAELLPPPARLDELRRRLRAPGSGILDRLNSEIRDDFLRIKDEIDLSQRTGGRLLPEASGAIARLRRLANMLATLGQSAPQQALLNQARALEAGTPDILTWMDVATAILRVEHSLEEALFRSLGRHGDSAPRSYNQIEAEVPHARDLRDGTRALLRECLLDSAQLRAAVEVALNDPASNALATAGELLHEIGAALRVLGHEAAAAQAVVLQQALGRGQFSAATAAPFADALICIEVYLEALRDGLHQPAQLAGDLAWHVGRFAATSSPSQPAAAPEPMPATTSAAVAAAPVPVPTIEADPELLAIFADEANEVLASLRRGLPALQRDPADTQAITPLRRGFHTLKGSGRTVGATRIADLSWSLERLLNRCLEGTRPSDARVTELVAEAIELLPGLIAGLRQKRDEDPRIAALISRADSHAEATPARSEPDLRGVFCDDARQRLGALLAWIEQQAQSGGAALVDAEQVLAFHTLKGSAAVVNAVALSRLAGAAEHTLAEARQQERSLDAPGLALFGDLLRTGLDWVGALAADQPVAEDAAAPLQAALAAWLAPSADAAAGGKPAGVDETFAIEALDLVQGLEAEARAWPEHPGEPVAAMLHGGLLELAGRAAAVGSQPLAEFSEALAARLAPWAQSVGAAPGPGFRAALGEAFETWYQLLDRYRDGGLRADSTAEALARLARLPGPGEPDLEMPAGQEAEPVEDNATPPDPELLDIFVSEADELLESLQAQFAQWRAAPLGSDAPGEMRRELHTLKGSARMAGVPAIGRTAHRLESLLDAQTEPAVQLAQMQAGFDGLQRQVDGLHRGEIHPSAPILAAIEAARRPAAVAPPAPSIVTPAAADPLAALTAFDAESETGPVAAPAVADRSVAPSPPEAAELSLGGFESNADAAAPPAAPVAATPASSEGTASSDPLDAPLAFQLGADLLVAQTPSPAAEPPAGFQALEPVADQALELQRAPEPAATDRPTAEPEAEPPVTGAPLEIVAAPEPPAAEAPPPVEPIVELPADEIPAAAAPEPLAAEAAPVPLDDDLGPLLRLAPEAEPESPPATETAAAASPPQTSAPTPESAPRWQADTLEELAPSVQFDPFVPPPPAKTTVAAEPLTIAGPELRELYALEAAELLGTIGRGFTAWRGGLAGAPILDLLRGLHTMKGSARIAELPEIADRAEALESQVNAELAETDLPDAATLDGLYQAYADLHALHEPLGIPALPPLELAARRQSAPAPARREPREWAPDLFWQAAQAQDSSAARRETARVPVEILDKLLDDAGEVAVMRSRIDEGVAGVRAQLAEMTQTLGRVREQLRLLDIETEAQIAARGVAAAPAQGSHARDFDPLELDRYSRMQELSRALAESLGDLGALQGSMTEAVGNSESLLQQQGRVAAEVQQGLMGTLMVPFSRQAQRLQRLVRQVALENGRQAELEILGGEAELDRNVLERMVTPLEHLLRNAVVHGIERPEARTAAGKPAAGTIRIDLKREGTQLLVEVGDDGAGLNLPAIRAKAVAQGLMPADVTLGDDALARFIFEPGFSTAEKLTQDAGRGIGMDVVGAEVKQLGGRITLHSEAGAGTRFRIRLPLTLAVSQVLMVSVGGEAYALPLPAIEGIARIPRNALDNHLRDDGPRFDYNGQAWRVRRLSNFIDLAPTEDETQGGRSATVVLMRLGEDLGGGEHERLALVVDRLIGNREIVSKGSGAQLSSVPGVAGATVLADGRVVLILDVPALVLRAARRAALTATTPVATRDERDTVMVVDDSVTMRRVAERLLTRAGYRVVLAKDGLDAIAQLQTEQPNLVLLDIEMPRADGFEVASFIRNSAKLGKVPIIMITSRSGDKHRARAETIGVDRYLTKPYQEEQLLAEIASLRGRKP